MKTLTGFAYVSLKVAMILSVEAGLFPLMCGWWMDICSYVSYTYVYVTITHYISYEELILELYSNA